MALKGVNLDDRRFQDLLESAIARANQSCPTWTDFSPSDPGRVLIEVFAYLTDVMLYRLNRLPEKIYVELLRLIGVKLQPPAAAMTKLRFTLKEPRAQALEIPAGTRVAAERSAAGGDPPVFATDTALTIPAGALSGEVLARHCDWIAAEAVGKGTGFPGQTVSVKRAPIIAPTLDGLDLIVGVEAQGDELEGGVPVRRHGDRAYRIWAEREGFADPGPERCIFTVDRASGVIQFAPALREHALDGSLIEGAKPLADVPAEGRQILVWYRAGGGSAGNVPAGALSKLKDPIPGGVEVTNPDPAMGGRSVESLEHALRRGPQQLHSLRRAITASDFEALALRSSGAIQRAYAYTKYSLWRYAPRGTVEIICIPHVPPERYAGGPLTAEILQAHEVPDALVPVQAVLEDRRPLGTSCLVRWGRCKKVRVKARVIVYRQEDAQAVRQRLLTRLYETITPISHSVDDEGWGFGQTLSPYDVYRVLTSEPGVKSAEQVELWLDDVPSENISALTLDGFQPSTWYAAAGDAVFRSIDDGTGWELIARIPEVTVRLLQTYPLEAAGSRNRAGLVAAITETAEGKSRVQLSRDCGESWVEIGARFEFRIEDMAWTDRQGEPALLLATEKGLYELGLQDDADPIAILVDEKRVDLGFVAVAVSTDVWGQTCVAVAAQARGGVYLSIKGGSPGTFEHIGLANEKVGLLAVQHRGPQRYLWVGMEAAGNDRGTGCSRWQLPRSPEGWRKFDQNWEGGGCRALAFLDSMLLAGTRRHGVLQLDLDSATPTWSTADALSGIPMESLQRMHSVDYLAARPAEPPQGALTMAAGPVGIFRRAEGKKFECCSEKKFTVGVTLPPTWLFCSDVHDIEVTHEARGD